MRAKLIYLLSGIGVALAFVSAYLLTERVPAEPPLFRPTSDPYPQGIYANGIVESLQGEGGNINLYPEVSGTISKVLVHEGQQVRRDTPLLAIDDSIQRATVSGLVAQADAAEGALAELRAEPRRETLAVARAEATSASAQWRTASDARAKQERSYTLDPLSVSRDVLDNARDAERSAAANAEVAQRQFELTRAGAWSYDIRNQAKQAAASRKAEQAASALLAKYVVRAPADGVVLSVQATAGSYVSPLGAYDANTQGNRPAVVMSTLQDRLAVRAYVDEILVSRLPPAGRITATMSVRGTDLHVPLRFVRVQPYVTPKIELSDQRQERVDVRVLPVVFSFRKPKDFPLFPGQIVDVFIGERSIAGSGRS